MNIALDKYVSSAQLIPFYYLMWVVYHTRECILCVHQEYLLGSTNTKIINLCVDKKTIFELAIFYPIAKEGCIGRKYLSDKQLLI